jgi:hypothetical protein
MKLKFSRVDRQAKLEFIAIGEILWPHFLSFRSRNRFNERNRDLSPIEVSPYQLAARITSCLPTIETLGSEASR